MQYLAHVQQHALHLPWASGEDTAALRAVSLLLFLEGLWTHVCSTSLSILQSPYFTRLNSIAHDLFFIPNLHTRKQTNEQKASHLLNEDQLLMNGRAMAWVETVHAVSVHL